MKRVVLRADDLGYSEAVNRGLAEACENKLPMSIGIMVNMPAAGHGLRTLHDGNYCLGVHVNISVGSPVCSRLEVPSLTDENGVFYSSGKYRQSQKDPAAVWDVEKEAEAQYQRFVKLVGREPDYMDIHAVASDALREGAQSVAQKHKIPFSYLPKDDRGMLVGNTRAELWVNGSGGKNIRQRLEEFDRSQCETLIAVFHPGYLDEFIMKTSSLNVQRPDDAALLRDSCLVGLLKEKYQLITYREL